jgi:energy-coupling factor transporter ATP-binding protein EcfA2
MISHLTIENFQSIGSLKLGLGKLTVITGPSNSGKSAVVRAIRHALTNPRGSGVVQVGAKQAEVSLVVEVPDGVESFTWVKPTKGGASYRVPGAVYTVTGSGAENLPDQVRRTLNLNVDTQVSDQFEGPFLLIRTPSQAASLLGSLSRADRVIQAVKHATAKEREAGGKAKTLLELQEAAQVRLDGMGWYSGLYDQIQALAPEADELYHFDQRRAFARLRLDNANYTASHARTLRDRVAGAAPLSATLDGMRRHIDQDRESYVRAYALRVGLHASYQAATGAASTVNEATTHQSAALQRLAALIDQLPGTNCPTCGVPITEGAARHIVGVHP